MKFGGGNDFVIASTASFADNAQNALKLTQLKLFNDLIGWYQQMSHNLDNRSGAPCHEIEQGSSRKGEEMDLLPKLRRERRSDVCSKIILGPISKPYKQM
jgi:hypothetical protein